MLAAGAALVAGVDRLHSLYRPIVEDYDRVPDRDIPVTRTRVGLNLTGLATFNRQQVFTNLIAQGEWFSAEGDGWKPFPAGQLDEKGWVRFLKPGQTAPRSLTVPQAPFRERIVRCTYKGTGTIDVGGIASLLDRGDHMLTMRLAITGSEEEGAWIELMKTDPTDPVRDIDCRETNRPATERFHPDFVAFVSRFAILRFLDWQKVNDNADVSWAHRPRPDSSSQAGQAGVSVEDMVDLANRVAADPWFLMPYRADDAYIEGFARLVHDRIDPARTVYVELGNEIWNDLFDAARQAEAEGRALGLGGGDAGVGQGERYAQKLTSVMRIWTRVFADRPNRLVRVAAAHNANPDGASVILGFRDTAQWVDALATAPYVWLDIDGYGAGDVNRIYARTDAAIEEAIAMAQRHRQTAARFGKRFIAYEGGQHLVTPNMPLAMDLQRDPRMGDLYSRYLRRWNAAIHSDLVLYASTAPIAEYGAWGLQEYGGQPIEDAPKLRAVQGFIASLPKKGR